MKILDWYILKRFLLTFFFILGIIMVIAVIFDVSERIDDFMKQDAPVFGIVWLYYKNFILFYGNLFSPLLVFLAVIFFTAQLAGRTEIVAMLSSGMSFKRLMLPYFIGATVLAAISFYLNNYLVPKANMERMDFEATYMYSGVRTYDKNIHKQIQPGQSIYFDKFNLVEQVGYQFSLENWEDNKLKSKIFASYVKWDTATNQWSLENFYERKFINGVETLREVKRLDTTFAFSPDEFAVSIEDTQMMDVDQLNEFIEEEKMKGSSNIPYYLIEKHTRNALPLSTYILTIMGVAISSRKVRGGIGAHIAIGLALAVSYILFMKVSTVYATNAGLDPFIAVWIPNILYGVLAAYLYYKAPK